MATTITTGKVEETPKLIEVEASTTESAVSQQLSEDGGSEVAASDGTKELKIEVHATAVHHEKLDPIVAHAQAHDLSHESAPVILNLPPFRIRELKERENSKQEMKTEKVFVCYIFHLILNFPLLKFLIHNSNRINFRLQYHII